MGLINPRLSHAEAIPNVVTEVMEPPKRLGMARPWVDIEIGTGLKFFINKGLFGGMANETDDC